MTQPTELPGKAHSLKLRVYYEDTDAAGIVYHGSFIRWAERGRTEYLRAVGFNHNEIADAHGLHFAVRHIGIDYLSPGKLDDMLEVRTEVTACGNTSVTMDQTVSRESKVLAQLKVTVVAISPEGRPVRLPPHLRQIFSSHLPAK